MHLFKVDDSIADVEPDSCVTLQRRLVLPPLKLIAVSDDMSQLPSQRIVDRRHLVRCLRKEIPRIDQRISDRRLEVRPALLSLS